MIVGRGLGPAERTNAPNGGSSYAPYDVNEGERYMKATGERGERRLWREERPERVAAVDKIED